MESKRLHFTPNNPSAKSHARDAKHQKQQGSDFGRAEGGNVDFTPQDEEQLQGRNDVTDEELNGIVESREGKEV